MTESGLLCFQGTSTELAKKIGSLQDLAGGRKGWFTGRGKGKDVNVGLVFIFH